LTLQTNKNIQTETAMSSAKPMGLHFFVWR